MTVRVTGVAHSAPPAHDQDRLWETSFAADYAGHRTAERIWRSARVSTRHLAVDPAVEDISGCSTETRMHRYQDEAPRLGKEAVGAALAAADVAPDEIGLFVVVSCTGYTAPGLDIQLARDLGMSPTLQRVVIGHMGCYAALPGLATVTDYVAARRRPAVLLSAELTSLHRQAGGADIEQVVTHALFADACAALVVEPGSSARGLEVLDVTTLTDTSTTDHMSWEVTDLGFRMGLSPRVPEVVRRHVGGLVASLLAPHGLTTRDVEHWAIHPGGPRIIDAVGDQLGLNQTQLAPSYGVLRDFGNCSSATVLLVLERLQPVAAGEYAVALTFGPGLTLCAALLQGC